MLGLNRFRRRDDRHVNRVASIWDDEITPGWLSVSCVVGLWLVVALSFERAFVVGQESQHLKATLPALILGATFAATLGRKTLGGGFVAMLATALVSLPLLFVRSDAGSVAFPTPATIADGLNVASSGVDAMLHDIAPVAISSGFLALLWVAGLVLGFLASSWIVVGRPIGGMLTGLMIVGYSGQIGAGPGRVGYGVAAAACTLAYFLSEARQRMEAWGGQKQKLAATSGVVSLLVASLIAGIAGAATAKNKPIIQLQSSGGGRLVIIKPLSDIRRQLDIDPPVEVMRVVSPRSTYWRLTSLDEYTGIEWLLEAETVEGVTPLIGFPDPPNSGEMLEQQFSITSLLAPWVPAAFAVREVRLPKDLAFDSDPTSSTVLIAGESLPGLKYSAVSILADRSAQREIAVKPHKPNDVEKDFGTLAKQITGNVADPFAQAIAIESHFRKYTYDDKVPPGHDVERLKQFLAARRGYCEQFAAVMTLMLRGLGIESRIGVGFLPGGLLEGEHIVSTEDAHAWVEAKLPGRGWVILDPTPGRGDAASDDQDLAPNAQTTPTPTQGAPTPSPTPPGASDPNISPPSAKTGGSIPWALLGLALPFGIPTAKYVRRLNRRKLTGAGGVVAAFSELVDGARELGIRIRKQETATEFVERVAPDHVRVGEAASEALFAMAPISDAASAWAQAQQAIGELKSQSSIWRRAAALFDPRSLFRRL